MALNITKSERKTRRTEPGRPDDPGNLAPPADPSGARAAEKVIREVVHIFRLLSDESRLRILAYLTQHGELHVSDLCARLGQSQPAVSHHLALLRVAGLIEPRREGKHNFYSVRIDRLSDMLAKLLSISGTMPKRFRFHDFTLTHQGR